jgi:hypothetical protein
MAIVLGVLFLGVFLITVPENHSEADNAFRYAWDVEHAPLHETLHRHHVLYVPLCKVVHAGVRVLNSDARSYPVMIGLSMLAGAVALAFLYLAFRRHLGFGGEVACFSAGLVGASYGFWRYACEAEIPVVAAAPLAIAFYLLTCPRINALGVLGAAVASALAAMLHILAVIPVLFAFPSLLMGRGRRAPLIIYILLLIGLLVAGYSAANTSPFAEPAQSQSEYGDVRLMIQGPSALGNAVLGFGRATLSGNYLFCLRPFREFSKRVFSHRTLREELLIGMHAGARTAVLPLVLLIMLGLVGILVTDDRLSPADADSEADRSPSPHEPFAAIRRVALIAMVVWAVLHSLFLLGYEPANPESWILVCIPFWLALVLVWEQGPRGIPPQAIGTLFVLLLLHNYFGGMHLVADGASDYNRAKSQWVIDHARENDAILTDENPAYCWYVRYHTPAKVISIQQAGSAESIMELITAVKDNGGHVMATPDVFSTVNKAGQPSREEPESVALAREALRKLFTPVAQSQFGDVWLFSPEQDDQ